MIGMVRYLKASERDVYEEEQVLNVTRALLDGNEHLRSFKLMMVHNKNIQTFEAVLKHLEIEEEGLKAYAHSNVPFVAKGNGSKDNKPYRSKKPKKGLCPPRNSCSKGSVAKNQKAKGNGEKGIARVKCYNYGKKGHYAQDYPKLAKVLISNKIPSCMFISIHLLLTIFLNRLYTRGQPST